MRWGRLSSFPGGHKEAAPRNRLSQTHGMIFFQMTTVAVMQPYFMPYAGYFRLFAAADVFVAFDCVQFPRRGWVHRNRLPLASGDSDWLTLPIQKCDRDTRIDALRFAPDAHAQLERSMRRFPCLQGGKGPTPLLDLVTDIGSGTVADYLCGQLAQLATLLGMVRPIVRSSTLGIAADVHRQDRVLAVARALGATRYVNSPGGLELYDPKRFADSGIELKFLAPFSGPMHSILALLMTQSLEQVAALIRGDTVFAADQILSSSNTRST